MPQIVSLIAIMIISGLCGGYANYLLSKADFSTLLADNQLPSVKPQASEQICLNCWEFIVLGVIATFTVPLFLSLAQSDLLKSVLRNDGLEPDKVFVFGGFCLIAAISSRAFLQTISSRVIALANDASRTSQETKRLQASIKADVEEIEEVVGSQTAPDETIDTDNQSALDLGPDFMDGVRDRSADELDIFRALQKKPYTRRTLAGISRDSLISKDKAKELLGKLVGEGLVREIPSKKTGNSLYILTSTGAYAAKDAGLD